MDTAATSNNVYILLLLGMVAVGAHAYNLFRQPVEQRANAARWRLLSAVPIQLSTTQSRFRLGLTTYITVYELVYLMLASSSSLLLMAYQISGRQDLTGALSESVAPNSTVPILASTALILLSQIPPFSQLEMLLRRFSHRIAQIPSGIKSVKQRASEALSQEKSLQNQNDVERELAGLKDQIDSKIYEDLLKSQTVVSWLFEHTLGPKGSVIWDDESPDELTQLIHPVKSEFKELQSKIMHEADRANNDHGTSQLKVDGGAFWEELLQRSLNLKDSLTLLFCLLSTNQEDIEMSDDEVLMRIVSATRRREEHHELDIVIKSCVYGFLGSVVLLFCLELGRSELAGKMGQSPHSNKAPYGQYMETRISENDEQARLYPLSGLTDSEREDWSLGRSAQSDLRKSINESFWTALAFICASLVALSMNTPFIKSWQDHNEDLNKPEVGPVTSSIQFLTISLAAGFTAAIALFSYLFISEALIPALKDNIDALSTEIIRPFISLLPTVIRLSLAAVVCAIFIVLFENLLVTSYYRGKNTGLRDFLKNGFRKTRTVVLDIPDYLSGKKHRPRKNSRNGHKQATRIASFPLIYSLLVSFLIGLLVQLTTFVMGQSALVVTVVGNLLSTMLSFFAFVLAATLVMRSHKRRYVSPGSPGMESEKVALFTRKISRFEEADS